MTPYRILVVDDNPANLRLMEYLLRAFGHSVSTARNGVEGIASAASERPDLVLMDLHMPVMSGFDALIEMRQLPGFTTVPILAVTASAMMGDRDKIIAHGFDAYIMKPITPDTFVAQIEACIERRKQRQRVP